MLNQFFFIGTLKEAPRMVKVGQDESEQFYFKLIVRTSRKHTGWMNMCIRKSYLNEFAKVLKEGDTVYCRGVVRLTTFSKDSPVLVPLFDIDEIDFLQDKIPSQEESREEKIGF